ncbi:MAG: hypothetical protein A2W91_04635 [Bacteroidetes bacterium GWF2_38_335]|nr:MAG: hypothetical protein A2W91_04635 [Bacteroidetes bacterium GWF2_38_335]HBS88206.1 hypothetical protein [Bacteroidales bacterium]
MTFHHFSNNQFMPLVISSVILIASIMFFNFGRIRTSLVLLFLGTAGLGFFIANLDHFLILWDEQYHALVAKNLSVNPFKPTLYSNPIIDYNYTDWTGNHVWLHKQPLFLWQIALSLKLFGYNALAVRLPSIILHAIAVLLIYRIGKISANERTGFYGALFFAVAYYPLELIAGRYSTDHNDISFLFYVTASFWAWFEYQNSKKLYFLVLTGLFSGCAVLVKWLVGLLIYPIWFFTLGVNDKRNWFRIKSYKPIVISLLITIIIFLPWQLYILFNFPIEANYEFAFNTRHFFEPLENHGGNVWFHFQAIKHLYGSGGAVPYILLIGLFLYIRSMSSNIYRLTIISAIIIIYAFYSVAATKMISFCIIVSPFVFLGLGSLIDFITVYLSSKVKYPKFQYIIRLLFLILICFFLLNPSKIQKNHTDWKPKDNSKRLTEMREMEFIDKLTAILGNENYVVFNVKTSLNGHIPVMFFTDYIAYEFIPTEEQIADIQSKNYKIAVVDSGNLPDYIKSKKEIIKIKM